MPVPLSEQMRPASFAEIAGQRHLLEKDGWISKIVQSGRPLSILLWGPPGCGKTTIARLYAKAFNGSFFSCSAVSSSVADVKKIIKDANDYPLLHSQIILFVDEIHRFNKAQQDLFLPYLENGTLVLIAATTENPSFSVNNALLSRLRVLTLKPLEKDDLENIIQRYLDKQKDLHFTPDAIENLIALSKGDGRHLVNLLENIHNMRNDEKEIQSSHLQKWLQDRPANFDKHSDNHHQLISALHKAVRGSDPDAALYWFARMLEGGESAAFLARRLIRMAVEDVGLADPEALNLANQAWRSYEHLGSPEGDLALAEVVVYLALAPKSNSLYVAFQKAQESAKKTTHLPPPKIIVNGSTTWMKKEGYGEGYQYDHDLPEGFSGQNYFPDQMKREDYYVPIERGFERELKKRVSYFSKLRDKKNK